VDNTLAGHWWGLPAPGRYTWLADGRLQLLGSRIPADKLPDVKWEPIARWVQVILPPAAFPGHIPRGAVLQLTRSVEEAEPDLLLAPLQEWVDFAINAAELRLRPLRFAARSGQALIWGKPLPPLPGRRFVRHGRVAVPAGFRWTPAVSAEVLAHRLNVGVDAMALWHEDGSFTIMHTEQWVAATRGAVRATADALLGPALSLSKGHES
jgi:hypothetical protein